MGLVIDLAVILAGGSGTRFWPLSRTARPKHLLPLAGEKPLLRETFERLAPLADDVIVVTTERQRAAIVELLPELPDAAIVDEPEARNTLPAIGLAARVAVARAGPEATCLVAPADHAIRPVERFAAALEVGRAVVDADPMALVVFGVTPRSAHPGYGYVRLGDPIPGIDGARAVAGFVEKPTAAEAERLIAAGSVAWNAGIFLWRAGAIEAAIGAQFPSAIGPLARAGAALASGDRGALEAAYGELPSISIDHGVLQTTSARITCVETDFEWSDIGSWRALESLLAPDADGNVTRGRVAALDTERCTLVADDGGLVAAIGVADLIVVRAGDVTLVCPRDRAEEVKTLVERLRRSDPDRL